MILGTVITTVIAPFATLFGYVLAFFFGVTHSYGLSIMLLTLATMIVAFPLTQKGTRGMIEMQLIQPELLTLRNRYKKRLQGVTGPEKAEIQREQQAEMMALYKERGASPTGGCLPLFLQFPIFIVLYNVIRGMTHTVAKGSVVTGKLLCQLKAGCAAPLYVKSTTTIYKSLVASHGKADFLGFNLTDSLRSHPGVGGWGIAPYAIVLLVAVGLQYLSIWQITTRNNGTGMPVNPQMQTVQKVMPLIFLVFYYAFPAGVGIYFIVSSGFRIGQQAWMYKYDKVIVASMDRLKDQRKNAPPPEPSAGKKSFRDRMAEASGQSLQPASSTSRPSKAQGSGKRPPNSSSSRSNGPMVKPAGSGGAKKPTAGAAKRPAGSASKTAARNGRPGDGATGGPRRPTAEGGANGAARKPSATGGVRKQSSGQRPPAKRPPGDAPPGTNGRDGAPVRPRPSVEGSAAPESTNGDPTSTRTRRLRRPR
jgi:YidC/Oxa1 family membrane protein insertase